MRVVIAGWILVSLLGRRVDGKPCSVCHPAETSLHSRSRMASAMVPVLDSAFAEHASGILLHEPPGGYQFLYKETPLELQVISYRRPGDDNAVGTVRWVLGAGAQGQTPIVQWGDQFFESRISFFPRLGQYGITVGQTANASASAVAALGVKKTRAQLFECLNCHSTATSLTDIVPGVQCERCHAGAQRHSEDVSAPVVNPGKLAAPEQVRLCGACHRNVAPVDDTQLENVRFQPLRLMKSQCFLRGQIRCTTCHDAHVDARRADAAFYNAKCLSCHGSAHAGQVTTGCIGCHMPQIQLHPALKFTDHYIRIAKLQDYPAGSILQRAGDTTVLH